MSKTNVKVDGWCWVPRPDFTPAMEERVTIVGEVNPYKDEAPERKLFEFSDDRHWVAIPRTCISKILDARVISNTVTNGNRRLPDFPMINLYGRWEEGKPNQVEAVAVIESALRKRKGGILHAPCGQGKTVCALELIRRMGVPTLVLVHKTFLMDQWEERIKEFLPDATVGRWQQDRCDNGDDFDIVLGMVQSLACDREYPEEVYRSFGMVVADEVHLMGAATWCTAIPQFAARYRLGLTATPDRRDGLEDVFMLHIGNIEYVMEEPIRDYRICKVALSTHIPSRLYSDWEGKPHYSKLVSALAADVPRTKAIAEYVRRAVENDSRKVILFTHRRAHVEEFVKLVKQMGISVSAYMGGMKKEERKEAEQAQVIVATVKQAKEGLDIPSLDTIILATPMGDPRQAIGRLRPGTEKVAVLLDFVDTEIGYCVGLWRKRRGYYVEKGYLE